MPEGYVLACESGWGAVGNLCHVPIIKQEYVTKNDPRQIKIQYVDVETNELISEAIMGTRGIGYITVYSGIGASVSYQMPKDIIH